MSAPMESSTRQIQHTYRTIEAWREGRRHSIGSSEAGAIWSVSPHSSPSSLYASKVDGYETPIDPERALLGHLLEPVIAEIYKFRTHEDVIDPGATTIYRSAQWPFMTASLDRIIVNDSRDPGLLECKSRDIWDAAEWELAPPLHVVLQVQHALAVMGWERAVIGVMFGNKIPRFIEVTRDNDLIECHVERCREFWEGHIVARKPPPLDGHPATSAALKRYRPDPGTVIELGDVGLKLHQQLTDWKAALKFCSAGKEHAENELRELIGTANRAELPKGLGAYVLSEVKAQSYTVDRAAGTRLMFKEAK